jgi:phosphatidate cytidylyltransferase
MAFDPRVFRTRALTALVFVAVMLTGLLWNGWSFFLLFSVVHAGCWLEYGRLVSRMRPAAAAGLDAHLPAVAVIGWCGMVLAAGDLLAIGGDATLPAAIACAVALLLAVTIAYRHVFGGRRLRADAVGMLLLGLLYLSLPWALLLHIRHGGPWMPSGDASSHMGRDIATLTGRTMPLVVIATIWLNDTLAYLTGSFFGRTPLSRFSPRKTWEGTLGGIGLSVALVAAFGHYGMGAEAWRYGSVAFLTAVAGTLGDLLESWLKRKAGVKDSGSLMPGHGGFLDRFDSLLAAVPVVWLYCMLAGR